MWVRWLWEALHLPLWGNTALWGVALRLFPPAAQSFRMWLLCCKTREIMPPKGLYVWYLGGEQGPFVVNHNTFQICFGSYLWPVINLQIITSFSLGCLLFEQEDKHNGCFEFIWKCLSQLSVLYSKVQIKQVLHVGRGVELETFKSDVGNIKPLLHSSSPSNFVGLLSR